MCAAALVSGVHVCVCPQRGGGGLSEAGLFLFSTPPTVGPRPLKWPFTL